MQTDMEEQGTQEATITERDNIINNIRMYTNSC